MRILFLESPYSYGRDSIIVGKYFPLGIGYLAAFLRQHNHTVRILQPAIDARFYEECFATLHEYKPDMVAISAMTPTYPKAVSLCNTIKDRHDCVTVLGGSHVSAVGTDVLSQSPATDFAVFGEGELTLLELVEELEKGQRAFGAIEGLIWRDSNTPVMNHGRSYVKDLDSLPFPARDLVDLTRYRLHTYIDFGKLSATMITSRGCPYRCNFCSTALNLGRRYRYRSAENVIAEIEELVYNYNIDHIVFEDDTFTLRRERTIAICEGILRLRKKISWYCLSRVDSMDPELALLMRTSGCRMVSFGIESGSQDILNEIGKTISIPKAISAVKLCKKARIRTLCFFILGFPQDTSQTLMMTLDVAKRINPTMAIFFPLTPYPGTKIFNNCLDPEMIPRDADSWSQYLMTSRTEGVSVNSNYSGKELMEMAAAWNRRFYFRFPQVINVARSINSIGDFLNIMRGFWYFVSRLLVRSRV